MALLAMLLHASFLAQAGAGIGSPVAASVTPPVIPQDAAEGGVVIAELSVNASGRVEKVDAIRTTPPYDAEVLRAVARWTFQPQASSDPEALAHALVVAVIRPNSFPATPMAQPTDVAPTTDDVPFPEDTPAPPYPLDALGSGLVILDVHVNAQGQVDGTRVLSGSPPFTQVSEDTVREWSFRPASGRGPEGSTVYVVFAFREPVTGPGPGTVRRAPSRGTSPGAATSERP